MERIKLWLLKKLIGDMPVVANVRVFGGLEIKGPEYVIRDVIVQTDGDDADPYQWFTPARPAHALLTIRYMGPDQ